MLKSILRHRLNKQIDCARALLLFCLLVLPSQLLLAGSGRFHDGKFDIYVALAWNASPAELDTIQRRFDQASRLLFDATDSQARLGTVSFFNNHRGFEYADVVIIKNSGAALADARLGHFGESIVLYTDNDVFQRSGSLEESWQTIAHELAHYFFDLRDEFKNALGDTTGVECIETTGEDACLMDDYKRSIWNSASEFCWAGNHDPDGDSRQQQVHGQSCWETILNHYPDMKGPIASGPKQLPPQNCMNEHLAIKFLHKSLLRDSESSDPDSESDNAFSTCYKSPEFIDISHQAARVILVLDTSESLLEMNAAESQPRPRGVEMKEYIHRYIDMLSSVPVDLGIIAVNQNARVALDFCKPGSQACSPYQIKSLVNDLTFNGEANIAAGLQLADKMLAMEPSSGPDIIILITDGISTAQMEQQSDSVLETIARLRDKGTRLHIGGTTGTDAANNAFLRLLSRKSGSVFWQRVSSAGLAVLESTIAYQVSQGLVLDSQRTPPQQ